MPVFLRLLAYLRPYTGRIALAGACLLVALPAQLFHPLAWMFVVDEVISADEPMFIGLAGGSRYRLLAMTVAVMIAVHLLGAGLGAARTWLLGSVGQAFLYDLRTDLYRRLQDHSLAFFHRHRTGDLISRAMGDVDALEEVALRGTDEVVSQALQFLGVAAILLWLDWRVGLLTLVPMLGVAVMVRVFNRRVKGLYRRVRNRLGDVSAAVQESVAGARVVKAFGREDHELARFDERHRAYRDTSLKAVIARACYFPGIRSVGFLSNGAMIGGGAYFILQGTFTIGGLVAYRGYWWRLFSPVNALARTNEMLQRAGAAAGRVFELMDEPMEITDPPDAETPSDLRGHLRFENVSFSHAGRDRTLEEITFEAGPGEHVGVVGPSGAGKSTILSLALRLYDADAGTVSIDARDVRSYDQRRLRRHFGLVTQEPFLFSGTIADNLRFGRPEATDDEMREAARRANVHDFIAGLADGYETRVGERGVRLSGGQKQRLCIARAFLADPTVLLLDEPTASVEAESESIIQRALSDAAAGRTAIIVSHRMSMVRDADRILVIEDGRITERGTHDELMAADGWYARTERLQSGEEG